MANIYVLLLSTAYEGRCLVNRGWDPSTPPPLTRHHSLLRPDTPSPRGYAEIRSNGGRYAFYWNAFLLSTSVVHCEREDSVCLKYMAFFQEDTTEVILRVRSHLATTMCFFCRQVRTVTLVTMQPISDDRLTTSILSEFLKFFS